jgi:hypothetical protein
MSETKAPRPRNVLMGEFEGLSKEDASQALRDAGGDLDRARALVRRRQQAPAPQQPQRARDDDEAASLALARQLQAEEDAAPPPRRVDERPAKRPRSDQIERVHAAGGVLDPSILARVDAIVQQSNCVGCDGRGLAAAIAEKLPYGDTYKDRRPMPPARKFAIPEDRAVPGSIAVRRGSGPAVVSLFAQFEMGPAMKYRRVRPEPAGGDTKANRLRWFKEGLAKLAAEGFRRVAFPHEIGCALAGGSWREYEAAIAAYGAANPEVEILIVTWGGGGGGGGKRPGSGHCFKCGQPGHWANRCPNK